MAEGPREVYAPIRKVGLARQREAAFEPEPTFEQADGLAEFALEPVQVAELQEGRAQISYMTERLGDPVGVLAVHEALREVAEVGQGPRQEATGQDGGKVVHPAA